MQMNSYDIATLRNNLGLTQAEFAQLFGVHAMTVSKWEREKALVRPTAHQLALMTDFARAAKVKREEAQETLKTILVGAGAVAALFWLLSATRK
jgi:transcriptional regulator with XRE-family HTH domain